MVNYRRRGSRCNYSTTNYVLQREYLSTGEVANKVSLYSYVRTQAAGSSCTAKEEAEEAAEEEAEVEAKVRIQNNNRCRNALPNQEFWRCAQ